MEKVLIIVPAYNEAQNIKKVVDNLVQNYNQYDYLIINDGSTDATLQICQENKYNYLDLPVNLGIGGAVQTGYRYAYQNDYDIAIQSDGDGQHNLSYVHSLIDPIRKGKADVTIGSRFLDKKGFQSSAIRRMGIIFLSFLVKLCCGVKIRDITSGFRAVNRTFIKIYAQDYPTDFPEPEAIVTAVMHKGKIDEVPVIMNEREGGRSSIGFNKSIYYMIKVSIAIIVRRISFGIRR